MYPFKTTRIQMATSWRVMLSSKRWDQDKFVEMFDPETTYLAQSKGQCRMINLPRRGDNVVFVLKGKIVMKGFVDSDGFQTGTAHQNHSCNIGQNRIHAVPEEYAMVRITDVKLSQEIRKTGQRTWAKFQESMRE